MIDTRRRIALLGLILCSSALMVSSLLNVAAQAAAVASAPAAGNPQLLGHVGGAADDVALGGAYLFAVMGPELAVVDPSTAERVSYALTGDLLHAVALSGTHAVAVGSRLRRFDVTDPLNPLLNGAAGPTGDYRAVAAAGGHAFATRVDDDYPYGRLEVFRISGTQPAHLGGRDLLAPAYGVAVSGTLAGVAASTTGLLLLDAGNTTAPPILATAPTTGWAFDVAFSGDHAFVVVANCAIGCSGGLEIFDVTTPTAPQRVSFVPLPVQPEQVAVIGNRAYVANGSGGLSTIDISNPAQPVDLGRLPLDGSARAAAAGSDRVYVAGGSGGVHIVDVAGPPQLEATLPTVGVLYDAVALHAAALLGTRTGLAVADLSQPEKPVLSGRLPTAEPVLGVAASGDVAYLAAGSAGLLLADVSTPSAPILLSSRDTPGTAYGVTITGTIAYVADGLAGMQVFESANPLAPQLLATFDTPGSTRDIFIAGSRAYLADWDRGLRILDVANPAAPQELGLYNTPGEASAVAVAGTTAYVADRLTGLRVIDVSNPALPQEVASLVTQRVVADLALVGAYVYLTNDDFGVTVVDVSQPTAPFVVGSFDSAGRAWGIELTADGMILLADWLGGLYVLTDLFTIGGAVRQANRVPFPGANVALSGFGTATVNSAGLYVFADLPFGDYAITPTLNGYVFHPPAAQQTLPPSAGGIDFTILKPPSSTIVAPGAPLTWTLSDTQELPTQFIFPAGSASVAMSVVMTPTVASTGGGLVFAGHAWELAVYVSGVLQPEFLFDRPVSVTVTYNALDLAGVGDETALQLYRWSGTAWEPAGSACTPPLGQTVDPVADKVAAATCRSGTFALFGNPGRTYLPIALVGQ